MVISRRLFLLGGAASLVAVKWGCGGKNEVKLPYSVKKLVTSEGLEHQISLQGRHFLSLIEKQGMLILRPHPGTDPNGWGSSWYAQPFFSNSQPSRAVLNPILLKENQFVINSAGLIPNSNTIYGKWSMEMEYSYDILAQKITGRGKLRIEFNGTLKAVSADLDLFRIASNYLENVPLLEAGKGDTGDMQQADVKGNGFSFSWNPAKNGNHYPTDESSFLSIDVIGKRNQVDTKAQGFEPIVAAYKPGMKIVLVSDNAQMRFGASYDRSLNPKYNLPTSQLFFEDNVGITGLIHQSSSSTAFQFDILFESVALAGG